MIEGLYFSSVVLLILIIGFIWAYKHDKANDLIAEQRDIEWEKEQSKFIADVVFHTVDGIHKNTGWTCYQTEAGSPYNMKHTARYRAAREIDVSYRRSYFEDDVGVTYSACNVIKAYVEVRENDSKTVS